MKYYIRGILCTQKFNLFTAQIINNDDQLNKLEKDVNYYYSGNSSFYIIRKLDELKAILLYELPYLVLYSKNN